MTATEPKTIKGATTKFRKMVAAASGEANGHCDCCGGALPPESAYEEARGWSVDSGDCDGSVQSRNGHCRAFILADRLVIPPPRPCLSPADRRGSRQ